jgi:hypothetical protein
LIWNVALSHNPGDAKNLGAGELERCWAELADKDAPKAYAAMRDLVASRKEAVAWIKKSMKPAQALDAKLMQISLQELEDDRFKVRQKAASDLLAMGEQVVPEIDKALASKPPLETKQRLENLRGKLTGMILEGERLRAYRAIEVLELIGTPEARQLLQGLAEGATGALVTTSAQAAIKRLLKS